MDTPNAPDRFPYRFLGACYRIEAFGASIFPTPPALARPLPHPSSDPAALAIDHLPPVAVGVAGASRLDVGADAGDLVLRQTSPMEKPCLCLNCNSPMANGGKLKIEWIN